MTDVSQVGQQKVKIKVQLAVRKRVAEAEFEQYRIWTDLSTGLLWSSRDNGTDVNWDQAKAYCQNLILGGYLNWRLPIIDELERIYDQTKQASGYHIKGGIRLSGIPWSNSSGQFPSQALSFYFGAGRRESFSRNVSADRRALCVCNGEEESG